MFLMDDGIRIHVEAEMPEGIREGEKVPTVVLIHGFTGHMEETHIVAVGKALRDAGCAVLRAEMYGHGLSGGEFRHHTIYKWLTNLMTVIDYARGLDSTGDLYLCGHSQGGMAVMLAAAMKHDQIRGLIPMSPAWMIPEGAREGFLLGEHFDPDHVPDTIGAWGDRQLDGNYIRVAQTIHVEEAIDRYDGPVLIVHGDEDEAVPYRYGQEAAKRYRNAELVTIEGDDHCYGRHLDRVTEAIGAWMRNQIGKK
ncbi:MAG: alpha/beta fold hydrolase [Clostridia bacterium]|nr:alpha/beta fold hydrolase [Clostridia bacterium]